MGDIKESSLMSPRCIRQRHRLYINNGHSHYDITHWFVIHLNI